MTRIMLLLAVFAQVLQTPSCSEDDIVAPGAVDSKYRLGFNASNADFNCTGFVTEIVTLRNNGGSFNVKYDTGDGPYSATQSGNTFTWVRNWIGGGVHTVEQVTINVTNPASVTGSSTFTKEFINSGLSPCSGTSSITGSEI